MTHCRLAVRPCSASVLLLIAGASLGLSATSALGQRLISNDGGWVAPGMEFGSTTDSGDSDWGQNRNFTGGAAVLRTSGFANEDRDAANTPDFVRNRLGTYTRTFELSAAAGFNGDIVVPMLIDGTIQFAGVGNISNLAGFSWQVGLYREATAGAGDWVFQGSEAMVPGPWAAAGGNVNLSRTNVARFANNPGGARQYQLRADWSFDASAQGAIPGVPGTGGLNSRVDFDFRTAASDRGVVASLSAEPTAYNGNTREALSVTVARADFNDVKGRNARVGIVEVADVATNHVDLPAARLTILNGPGVNRYDNDEHATSVASIIGGANANSGRAGMAPESVMTAASIIDHGGSLNAANAIITAWGAGMPGVINYSASSPGTTHLQLDTLLAANDNVTWVSAGGNFALGGAGAGAIGTVPRPNAAYNNIAVGALESNFTTPTDFSSTTGSGNFPNKPDVMAPGEYVLTASVRDIDNGGTRNDYARSFMGATWGRALDASAIAPDTGRIAGTSFSAPHVTGMVALLHEYSDIRGFDATSKDHRVMKALVVGGAKTAGLRDRAGNAWNQGLTAGTSPNTPGANHLVVTRSYDPNLGGGLASATGSLHMYRGGEARIADNNTDHNLKIDLRDGSTTQLRSFWDLETVSGMDDQSEGTVDYFLGGTLVVINDIPQYVTPPTFSLRAALTWDREVSAGLYDPLANLELEMWIDGYNEGNLPGFDPFNADDDIRVARTSNANENVKLMDLSFTFSLSLNDPVLPNGYSPNFYLQVRNFADIDVTYGLAVSLIPVPAPGALGLLTAAGVLCMGRRRR